MYTIYTFGYTGQRPETLKCLVADRGAMLVDVRFRAWSRVERWRPEALKRLVGSANYRHVPDLGNVNYKAPGSICLSAPQRAVPIIGEILRVRPVVLLCGCADVHTCHRKNAAEYLSQALDAPVSLDVWNQMPSEQGVQDALAQTSFLLQTETG